MSEIIKDTSTTLALGITGATNASGQIYRYGQSVYTFTGDTVTLPFKIIGYDGPFDVRWQFDIDGSTEYRHESHTIVTPYVTGLTVDSDKDLEKTVRLAIESYTGQVFGFYHGSEIVYGQGQTYLTLPNRLVTLTSISAQDTGEVFPLNYMTIVGDGWTIAMYGEGIYEVREAPPLDGYYADGVIYAPSSRRTWQRNRVFVVEGDWGYGSIPQAVTQAANILFNQLKNADSEYRDRYIESVTSGVWTFEFGSRAWEGTGSASADALLAPYRKSAIGII